MKLIFNANFKKRAKKLPIAMKRKLKSRLGLFIEDPFNELLNNQALAGKWANFRTISLGNNYRAIFQLLPGDIFYFIETAKHS